MYKLFSNIFLRKKRKGIAVRDMVRGFTLIEILIVVAIIGILASVVLVGLGPVQRRGRDARRISDLRQIQTGLELYYNANGNYPQPVGGLVNETELKTITGISNIPTDPGTHKDYYYGVNADPATSYVLGAQLEDATNPALQGDAIDVSTYDVPCDKAKLIYCVQL